MECSIVDIIKTKVQDIHFFKNVNHQLADCLLLVDGGYFLETIQLYLFSIDKYIIVVLI